MDNSDFVIERGIPIYDKPRIERSGKWKELAAKMQPPEKNGDKTIFYSVEHAKDGSALTLKQSVALMKALSKLGFKGTSRKNGVGYRVWRIS